MPHRQTSASTSRASFANLELQSDARKSPASAGGVAWFFGAIILSVRRPHRSCPKRAGILSLPNQSVHGIGIDGTPIPTQNCQPESLYLPTGNRIKRLNASTPYWCPTLKRDRNLVPRARVACERAWWGPDLEEHGISQERLGGRWKGEELARCRSQTRHTANLCPAAREGRPGLSRAIPEQYSTERSGPGQRVIWTIYST